MALLIGFGAAAVNPYLALETIDDMIASGQLEGVTPRQAHAQLHQGGLQGRPQDHVQDGHLHRGLLHRGPDLRGRGPRPRPWSTSTSPARPAASAGSASTCWPPRWPPATAWPTCDRPDRAGPPGARARRRVPVAPGGRDTTSSTRRPSSSSSTPPGPSATTSSRSTPRLVDDQSEQLATLRGLLRLRPAERRPGPHRRGRAGRRPS